MIATWMLYSLATSAALFAGACAADYAGRAFNRATRMLWLAAMLISVGLAARALASAGRSQQTGVAAVSLTRDAASDASSGQSVADVHRSVGTVQTPALYQRLRMVFGGSASSRLAGLDRSLAWVAFASAALAMAYLGLSFVRLRRIERGLERRDLDGHTVLVSRTLGPALLGVVAPRIVVPEWIDDLSPTDRRLILAHEQGHAAARDPLVSLASAILVALQPWNVVLWMARSRLRLAIETDCDRRVLGATSDVRAYAKLLIAVHERTLPSLEPMVAFVERTSNLEWRVRQMTRRHPGRWSARVVVASAVAAGLVVAACTTPEPTGGAAASSPPSSTLSSITGGGRCLNLTRDDPRGMFDEMRALARARHPDLVAKNDSTDVIGFLLDENCNVRHDTAGKLPAAPKSGDAAFHAVFPSIKRDSSWRGGTTFLYATAVQGHRRWGPTVVFLIDPSASWRARRAADACGFGTRSDEFCSVMGSVAMRRIDSTRLVIAVRGKPVRDSSIVPADHYFLVSSLRPLPDSLTRRIRFARVMYQHNAVYVENRVTTELPVVFGSHYAPSFADLRMPRVTYDSLIGIAHYASPGVTLENIDELRRARKCDGPTGSCYEVAGRTIEFPN